MNNNPLVSVLVPIYNVEPYLERCVESLFRQTYDNIEFVFVDDCTPDGSMALLDRLIAASPEKRVKVVRHEKNCGLSWARQTLIENCEGEYTLFVDSDDWVEDDMVEALVGKAVEEDADICGCDYFEDSENSSVVMEEPYPDGYEELMRALIQIKVKGNIFKYLVRRSLYTDNNLRFLRETKMAEDWIMTCKLFYHCRKFASVRKALYHYIKFNPTSYTARFSHASLKNIEYQAEAIREVERFYREKGAYDKVSRSFDLRKFVMKAPLVLSSGNFRTWRQLFPEVNGLWRRLSYGKFDSLLFFMAENKLDMLSFMVRIRK